MLQGPADIDWRPRAVGRSRLTLECTPGGILDIEADVELLLSREARRHDDMRTVALGADRRGRLLIDRPSRRSSGNARWRGCHLASTDSVPMRTARSSTSGQTTCGLLRETCGLGCGRSNPSVIARSATVSANRRSSIRAEIEADGPRRRSDEFASTLRRAGAPVRSGIHVAPVALAM